MIPNSSQTYKRRNTVAKSGRGIPTKKNWIIYLKTKTIPIDDQVKIL